MGGFLRGESLGRHLQDHSIRSRYWQWTENLDWSYGLYNRPSSPFTGSPWRCSRYISGACPWWSLERKLGARAYCREGRSGRSGFWSKLMLRTLGVWVRNHAYVWWVWEEILRGISSVGAKNRTKRGIWGSDTALWVVSSSSSGVALAIDVDCICGNRYHYLNHYALFGGGYRSSAVDIMKRLAGKYRTA